MHRLAALIFLLLSTQAEAQEVFQLITARDFHQMKSGPEKSERIRDLEYKGWIQVDTFYDLDRKLRLHEIDLAPFVDDLGESVFLVADVSPEFPGGSLSQADYFQNLLGDLLAKPNEQIHNTLYIKFSVTTKGEITEVERSQPFPAWVPATTGERCLQAVKEMPQWSIGIFKNRPVKVKMIMTFSLGE